MTVPRMIRLRGWTLSVVALALTAFGAAAGALPLTGVEPDGQFVDCGPAVFGRPSRLPDALCGRAYNQLPIPLTFLTYASMGLAVVAVLAAIAVEVHRSRTEHSRVVSV